MLSPTLLGGKRTKTSINGNETKIRSQRFSNLGHKVHNWAGKNPNLVTMENEAVCRTEAEIGSGMGCVQIHHRRGSTGSQWGIRELLQRSGKHYISRKVFYTSRKIHWPRHLQKLWKAAELQHHKISKHYSNRNSQNKSLQPIIIVLTLLRNVLQRILPFVLLNGQWMWQLNPDVKIFWHNYKRW